MRYVLRANAENEGVVTPVDIISTIWEILLRKSVIFEGYFVLIYNYSFPCEDDLSYGILLDFSFYGPQSHKGFCDLQIQECWEKVKLKFAAYWKQRKKNQPYFISEMAECYGGWYLPHNISFGN